MVGADQADREANSIDWSSVDLRDKDRETKVVEILKEGKVKTKRRGTR